MKLYILLFCFILLSIPQIAIAQPNQGILLPLETPTTLSQPISQVFLDPHDKDRIFIHTKKHIYASSDFAASWEKLFEVRGIDEDVISVTTSVHDTRHLFVTTTRKIYRLDRAGGRVKTIFQRRGVEPLYFAEGHFDRDTYLAGTSRGCFITYNAGVTWNLFNGLPLHAHVGYVVFHPNEPGVAFAVTDKGLYRIQTNNHEVRKVMTLRPDMSNDDSGKEYDQKSDQIYTTNAHISFSLNDDDMIYFVFNGILYHSQDGGLYWGEVPMPSSLHGVSSQVRMLSGYDALMLTSKDALWLYNQKAQHPFKQLSALPRASKHSFDLYEGKLDTIVISLERSLYYHDVRMYTPSNRILINKPKYNEVLRGENHGSFMIDKELPSVRELQDAAIRYALLSTRRMKSWEQRSRYKSLLPSFSFDVDFDSSNNIDIDRGSTTSADIFLDGPDEEEISYGVSFDWDFSELIWNDTETSIEIRQRALVDQRDEILREVTRLYFEYKRLEREHSIFVELDPQMAMTNEIRCEEIRAQLDALTGGCISDMRKE